MGFWDDKDKFVVGAEVQLSSSGMDMVVRNFEENEDRKKMSRAQRDALGDKAKEAYYQARRDRRDALAEELDLAHKKGKIVAIKGLKKYPDYVVDFIDWINPDFAQFGPNSHWTGAAETYWLVSESHLDLDIPVEVGLTPLGTFEQTTDKFRVSDTCYDLETWCAGTLENVKPGTYRAYQHLESNGEKRWTGQKARLLIVVHNSHELGPYYLDPDSWLRINHFHGGMDAGHAGVVDLAFYRNPAAIPPDYQPHWHDEKDPVELWYDMTCKVTLSRRGSGVIPYGAVSESGYGDGGFNTYVRQNDQGKIIAVLLDFEGFDPEDEENDEEDLEESDDAVEAIAQSHTEE